MSRELAIRAHFWTARSHDSDFVSGLAQVFWPDGTFTLLSGGGVSPRKRALQVLEMVASRGYAGVTVYPTYWRWPVVL